VHRISPMTVCPWPGGFIRLQSLAVLISSEADQVGPVIGSLD
jgi:hypothetical protein